MKKNTFLLSTFVLLLAGSVFFNNQANAQKQANPKFISSSKDKKSKELFSKKNSVARTQESSAIGLAWSEMGPDNAGGRTRCILALKSDPNILFAGSPSGGLWKSTDGGNSWNRAMSQTYPVSSIVQDRDGYIYFATGENLYTKNADGLANGVSSFLGNGVFKSTNLGSTFYPLTQTEPVTPTLVSSDWAIVNKLAADPARSGRVYAATNNGLRRSNDGGATWENPIPGNTKEAIDVVVGGDGTVYAAFDSIVSSVTNRKCWLYISSNGATGSFIDKSPALYGSAPLSNGLWRMSIAVAPSDPNYVYIAAQKGDGKIYNIYQSVNKGQTWAVIGPGGSAVFDPFGAKRHASIVVHPTDKEKIYVAGAVLYQWKYGTTWTQKSQWNSGSLSSKYIHSDIHDIAFNPTNPDIMYFGTGGGVFITRDGANSFQPINKGLKITQYNSVSANILGDVFGGTQDNGALLIKPSSASPKSAKLMFAGDLSTEANGSSCYSSVVSAIGPTHLISATQFGNIARSPDGTELSQMAYNDRDLGGATTVYAEALAAYAAPMALWETLYNPNSKDSVLFTARKHYNVGDPIKAHSRNAAYEFEVQSPVVLDSLHSVKVKDIVASKFFIGLKNGVWMTKDALVYLTAPRWDKIATIAGTAQCLAYSKDGDYLFVGTTAGKVYRISNLLFAEDSLSADVRATNTCVLTTKLIADESTTSRPITSIAVDPNDPSKVIYTMGGYGYNNYINYSSNAIDPQPVFSSIQGDLPKYPVYSSVILLFHSNTALIGTEKGIYTTQNLDNGNPNWTSESGGIGEVPVYQVKQQTYNFPGATNFMSIYIGTHGRGIWEARNYVGIEDISNTTVDNTNSISIYPNPATEEATISFTSDKNTEAIVSICDLQGRVISTKKLSNLASGTHTTKFNVQSVEAGTYFVQIKCNEKVLSSKFVITK